MKTIPQLYNQLAAQEKRVLHCFALFNYYFNYEPSTILPAFVENLNNFDLIQDLDVVDFQNVIKKVKDLGLIEQEPNTAILKIAPCFTQFLRQQISQDDHKKLIKVFVDFNSGFANYLNEVYLNSNDDDLYEEGLKVILFELQNFIKTIYYAISLEEDFIHVYHIIDTVLDLEEEHEKRLYLANSYLQAINQRTTISRIDFLIEQGVLISFIGDTYYRLNKTQLAIETYQAALKVFEEYNAEESKAMALLNLGSVYADLNQLKVANEYYQQGIQILEQILGQEKYELLTPTEVSLIQSYVNLGQNYYSTREYEVAIHYQEKAIQLAEKVGDSFNKAIALQRLGLIAVKMHNYAAAQQYYLDAAEIYNTYHYTYGIGEINQNLGYLFDEIGETEAAIEAYKQSLEIFIILEDDYKQAEIFNNLASIEYKKVALPEAKFYFERALSIAQTGNNPHLLGLILQGLGSVYLDSQDIQNSISYYDKALSQFQQINAESGIADIYLNFSSLYLKAKQFDLAQNYANQALPYFEKQNLQFETAQIYLNLATCYQEKNNHLIAIQYYEKAITVFEKQDWDYASYAYQQIGMIYYQKEDHETSENYYLKALQFAEKMERPLIQKYIYQSLARIAQDSGQAQKAQHYLDNFNTITE